MALSPDLLPISASAIGIVERRWWLTARATRALAIGLGIGALVASVATVVVVSQRHTPPPSPPQAAITVI